MVRWANMLDRCENPHNKAYKNYGGRGITVCQEWHDFFKYLEDLPDGYFDKAELDRIDNSKGYSKENVRWLTKQDNCKNRRTNRFITFNNETKCVSDWARNIGIGCTTLMERIENWSLSDALTLPKGTRIYSKWDGHLKKPRKAPKQIKMYEYQGLFYKMKDLAKIAKVPQKLLRKRISERGWEIHRAVETE
jgi:hypothetical protein